MDYREFLESKGQYGSDQGFDPVFMPDFLYDFQRELTEWAIRKGRGALFADCGLGKTPMQLVWAENVVRHTNKPVLIATPLAVSYQLLGEAEKFDIQAVRVIDGKPPPDSNIVVTNYERLEHFNPDDFSGMVCDESSILKNFAGVRKATITEFMRRLPYRLLCTATAAPNDYIELGTSSEALGGLAYMDMLTMFFKHVDASATSHNHMYKFKGKEREEAFLGKKSFWRFKGHAEDAFWKWVSSWAKAIRKPSDYGYDNDGFVLPNLTENEHLIIDTTIPEGYLFNLPAVGMYEQRQERKRTIKERCAKVEELVKDSDQALVWCHYNDEGDLLTRMIDDAVQVKGSDTDEAKEERLLAFAKGEIRVLVTKPKIGAWGLNLQKCSHITFFPSHSYEQYYQGVRRCWRFGQKRPVTVDVVTTKGEVNVMENLKRKSAQADRMFDSLMEHMNDMMKIKRVSYYDNYKKEARMPTWLSGISS